ncbi:MAG TPA: tetratricopeptide repeat protein [Kofleriaceae bacterium]|nr:tetratricopeptide repeat protein [Kofleriaceae bacterium]
MVLAAVATIFLLGLGLGLTACDELGARTLVQKGNALYDDQEYEKAIDKYEAALKKSPGLMVIHHNLGLAYARLFRPGVETDENKAYVNNAALHLQKWLEKHPNDLKVQKFLLNLWIDAAEYKPVLDYFMAQYQKDPNNRYVVGKIAGLYLMMTDWRTAIDWRYKDLALAADDPAKVAVYKEITNTAFGQLWTSTARMKQRGADRAELAEIGLKAAEDGLAIDPDNIQLNSFSQGLWNQRAIAEGPYWGAAIDRAEAQIFEQRVRVLSEEAKKNQPPAPPPGSPTTPATPATGS